MLKTNMFRSIGHSVDFFFVVVFWCIVKR